MTMEEISERQTLLLGAWGNGRNGSKYCCVDIISAHSRSALKVIAILSMVGMLFWSHSCIFCYRCSIHLHT